MLAFGTKLCTAVAVLLVYAIVSPAVVDADEQICDVAADIALNLEDYPTAIVLHRRLLRLEPDNALAHYHLGFAYGIAGRAPEEIAEYRTAARLGLTRWDLFLNLGLAYYAENRLENATSAFETAVLLGPDHPEAHFNLALAYERADKLVDALREVVISLVLKPNSAEAANTAVIIYARMGEFSEAREIWTQLVLVGPSYTPARINLTILNRSCVENFRACSQWQPRNVLLQRSIGK